MLPFIAKEMAFWVVSVVSRCEQAGRGDDMKRKTYQEFGCVGHQSEKRDAQELLIDRHSCQDGVHSVDQDLSNDGVEECGAK